MQIPRSVRIAGFILWAIAVLYMLHIAIDETTACERYKAELMSSPVPSN